MLRPQTPSTYWVLDRKAGKKVLVTPEVRQLYRDATRYIKLRSEPIPQDTQEIIKIRDAQLDKGVEQGDFDPEDVNWAMNNRVNSRTMANQQARKSAQEAAAPPVPAPTPLETHLPAEESPVVADTPEAPPPKKKVAKKKAARKKAAE